MRTQLPRSASPRRRDGARCRRAGTGPGWRRFHGLAFAAAAVVPLVAAGCETDEIRTEVRTPAAEAEQQDPLPGTPVDPVLPLLDEWRIVLEPNEIDAGRHDFVVINEGIYDHALVVEGQGQRWSTPIIPPGGQARFTAEMEPGIYLLYCPIENELGDHSALGMRTTLEVE